MKFPCAFLLFFIILSCKSDLTEKSESPSLTGPYTASIEEYRSKLMDLRKNGYLQLVGLLKMDKDSMYFGKHASSELHLDIKDIADTIALFVKKDSLFNLLPYNKLEIKTENDSILGHIKLKLDEFGNSIMMMQGSLKWQIITRNNNPYLRVWDKENPEIERFKGFEYYPLNSEMIFEATFKYFDTTKSEKVNSQLGPKTSTDFIGRVSFSYLGQAYSLDVGNNGFTMVADKTTSGETYGGGRYIYLDLPEHDGKLVLDFNKLYNPPCSFNKYTTCLYPPQQNDLAFKVEAGETITPIR